MTFSDAFALIAALAVVLLPGAALLAALGVFRPLWFAGLAPVASVGVATLVGMGAELVGLPYNVVSLGIVTAVLAVVGGVRWWRTRKPGVRRNRWRTASVAAGVVALVGGIATSVVTWMVGMAGDLSKLPQEHDTIVHTELTAYIMNTGVGAAWKLLPIDFTNGTPVNPYPSGMHLLSAATGELTGSPIVGFNAVSVILLGVCYALSASALGFLAARRSRLNGALALMAGGLAALVAVGMNAPTITLAAQGGVLPNAAALVLSPGIAAVLLSLRKRDWWAVPAIAVGFVGLVALHPSAIMSVGVTVVAWWIGELFVRGGWARLRSQIAPLVAAGVASAVLAAPLLLTLTSQSGRTAAFPPDISARPLTAALGATLALPFSGYLPKYEGLVQMAALVLAVFGVVVMLMSRRGFGLLAAVGAWVAVSLGMWLSPGVGFESVITGFFYNAMLRIRTHYYLFVPMLVGVGVVLAVSFLAAWLRRRAPLRGRGVPATAIAAALALVVVAGYALVPARGYAMINAHYLSTRYGKPDLIRVGKNDVAAINFLAGKVGPGERVMNCANDGSSYLYVLKGIPIVNTIAMGWPQAPYTYKLLQRFNKYPNDPEVRKWLLDLNVTWVYVDTDPPPIGAAGSPEDWAGGGIFSFPPGLAKLDGLPGLKEEFRSGTVHVYKLDRAALTAMGTQR